jgi:hypothetical protein
MKKRYLIVLVVLTFFAGMMAGVGGFSWADDYIQVYINGERLNSIPGPREIDGRVFVPLRAVSDAMGASVGWDGNSNTAYIATQRDALTDIEIVGDAAFKEAMTDALKLLKDKSPADYALIGQYVRVIVLDDSTKVPRTYGYDMIIHVPTDYSNADKMWWAAILAHEAMHLEYWYNVQKMPREQEELNASKKQKEVLRKIGAPQWMIEYVENSEDEKWWEGQ